MKIQFKNFILKYEDKYILEIDDYVIDEHQFQLLGDNGSGKTSFVDHLYKLKSNYSGSLTLNGTEIRDISIKDIRKKISYINQKQMLIETLSIQENIKLLSPNPDRVINLLRELNNEINLKAKASSLSGGQKQTVNFCIDFLKPSEILILDEIFNHLDADVTDIVTNLILNDPRDKIYITHKTSFTFDEQYELKNKEIIKL